MTKKLFVFIINGGDGSYSTNYTFDEDWLDRLNDMIDNEELPDGVWEMYVDGDGFHYDTLMVPDECTPESMGFSDPALSNPNHQY